MCGEKRCWFLGQYHFPGSPPHVRGKVVHLAIVPCGEGITPACAGKRANPLNQYVLCWDHPRMCGEKYHQGKNSTTLQGSPPHVRGKVRVVHLPVVFRGITPACAGKRFYGGQKVLNQRDHPRMCGEK